MIIVLLLIIANGIFAMAEISVVSARKVRLQQQANEGKRGAQQALRLANDSEDFLSTVQIGITLIGILAGVFGGQTIATDLAPLLENLPLIGPYSESVSLGIVVVIITYLSLVIGELVPKQIGLNNPERIASLMARPMNVLATVALPLVRLLSFSTRLVLRLLRIKPAEVPPVTVEELQILVQQGAESGIINPQKEEMVEQVLRLDDQRVNALMTDRTDIVWLDLDDPLEVNRQKIIESGHSRFPVSRDEADNLLGIVFGKDLLAQSLSGKPLDLEAVIQPALFVPEGLPVLELLERFKEEKAQIAFVLDEHGGVEGLLTFNDLLETIVGDVPEFHDPEDPTATKREDGSWLVDGKMLIDDFKMLFNIDELPEEEQNFYQTLGGFVMLYLGRIPRAGDTFEWEGFGFEVMDMDWRRVDKVLLTPRAIQQGVDGDE
ncbi:hemolysin family protein [Candidatus Leptofilum sp.]|uniref:hemolysin family protein n=1 Tax=Candidatus Leptofilum sp. TaxID=3241576 RepID=UPI003B5B3CBF